MKLLVQTESTHHGHDRWVESMKPYTEAEQDPLYLRFPTFCHPSASTAGR